MLALCCGSQASLVVVHELSCPKVCGILVPPAGIKPASPALEGGFLTAGPPGKSPTYINLLQLLQFGEPITPQTIVYIRVQSLYCTVYGFC